MVHKIVEKSSSEKRKTSINYHLNPRQGLWKGYDVRRSSQLQHAARPGPDMLQENLVLGNDLFSWKETAIIPLPVTARRQEINCLRVLDILNTKGKRIQEVK